MRLENYCGFIHTDGSKKDNSGLAAVGRVLRNHNIDFIGAFAVHLGLHLGLQSSVFAEVKAMLLDLRFAKSFNFNQVWTVTDFLLLVNSLTSLVDVPCSIAYIIRGIKQIAFDIGNCKFTHVHRECNGGANAMANLVNSRAN